MKTRAPTCPICQASLDDDAAPRPFCSERCKLIDLGHWLGESYRTPALEDPFDPYDEPV